MRPDIQGILFDKDGTLLDFHLSWGPINRRVAAHAARGDEALAQHLLKSTGLDMATGRARSGSLLAAGTTRQIAEGFIAAGSTYPLPDLTKAIDDIFRAGVEGVVPVLDLAPFFRRLKQRGLRLGIASSDSEQAIRLTAARFGFVEDLDFVAGWDSGFGAKPSSGMLDAFARHCGLAAARIAVVGDNLHDLEMAAAGRAGLKVGVLTGTSSRDQLAPAADICLDSIAELEAALFG